MHLACTRVGFKQVKHLAEDSVFSSKRPQMADGSGDFLGWFMRIDVLPWLKIPMNLIVMLQRICRNTLFIVHTCLWVYDFVLYLSISDRCFTCLQLSVIGHNYHIYREQLTKCAVSEMILANCLVITICVSAKFDKTLFFPMLQRYEQLYDRIRIHFLYIQPTPSVLLALQTTSSAHGWKHCTTVV